MKVRAAMACSINVKSPMVASPTMQPTVIINKSATPMAPPSKARKHLFSERDEMNSMPATSDNPPEEVVNICLPTEEIPVEQDRELAFEDL